MKLSDDKLIQETATGCQGILCNYKTGYSLDDLMANSCLRNLENPRRQLELDD